MSAAYYAAFHAILTAAADRYVGVNRRASVLYSLAYRSVDHKELRNVCANLGKLGEYVPPAGFDADTRAFAEAVLELRAKRLDADYNPAVSVRKSDARLAVGIARYALQRLQTASPESREAFLGLLLFKAR